MNERLITLAILSIFGGVLLLVTKIQVDTPDTVNIETSIPYYDGSKTPLYFDFQSEKWVYEGDRVSVSSTKDYHKSLEKEVDELLQRKVKGYKESTYWGEDYEFDSGDN